MAVPLLALLDSFERAHEVPLSNGGKWSPVNGAVRVGEVVAEAIPDLYANVVKADEPLAYWRLNETEGTAAKDSIAAHDAKYGTSGGTYTLGEPSMIVQEPATRSVLLKGNGKAAGTAGHVTANAVTGLQPANALTVEAWVRLTELPTTEAEIFDNLNNSVGKWGFGFSVDSAGKLKVYVTANPVVANYYVVRTTAAVLKVNETHHVAAVYAGGATPSVTIYVDGVVAASTSVGEGAAPAESIPYTGIESNAPRMGATNGGFGTYMGMYGRLSDVALYDKALTAERLLVHYAAGAYTGRVGYAPTSTAAEGEDAAYWNVSEFANPTVAFQVTKVSSVDGRTLGVWACLLRPQETLKTGYRLRLVEKGAGKCTLLVEKCVHGAFAPLVGLVQVPIEAMDRFALSAESGIVSVLKMRKGVGRWEELAAATDSSFNRGFVGILASGPDGLASATDFEVGEGDPSGDLLYERTQPLYGEDEPPNSVGHVLTGAIMAMLQGMDQIALDTDTHPGWTTVLDPATCPDAWLKWCAQIYGVTLPPGASLPEQRRLIQELAAQGRGTITALIAAAAPTLTGEKRIFFTERAEGKAYKINVHTLTKETPSTAATLAALLTQKPGGIVLTLTVSESPTWEEATKEWHSVASTVTWGNATPGTV